MSLNINTLLSSLEQLVSANKIRAIDHQFARFVSQYEPNALVVLASAIASHYSGQGHVCVDLASLEHQPLFGLNHVEAINFLDSSELNQQPQWPQQMLAALSNSEAQGDNAPLMLVGNLLYLQRYWQFEQQLAKFLTARSTPQQQNSNIANPLRMLFSPDFEFIFSQLDTLNAQHLSLNRFCHDYFHLREDLAIDYHDLTRQLRAVNSPQQLQAFASQFAPQQLIDWQQVAVAVATHHQFSVISGGPGTGKTTTVLKLLALLIELDLSAKAQEVAPPLTIELVAPTGKAAARLSESISSALTKLNASTEIKQKIPTSASTIHRLLGVIPHSNRFKHDCHNKLHVDVLIIDEASMIDISLMARLFDAIAPHTKIIMLGDSDQLSSVEAGSVFADICGSLHRGAQYSPDMCQWLETQTGFEPETLSPPHHANGRSTISDSLAYLHKSYRFDQFSGIGALARAVNHSDISELKHVWQQGYQDIGLHSQGEQAQRQIVQMAVTNYRDYLLCATQVQQQDDVREVIRLFNTFQLLSPMRSGKSGIDDLNVAVERSLNRYGLVDTSQGVWYIGRPIMINSNDHAQQLYNGDIGIFLPDIEQPNGPGRVYFIMASGEIKSFLPSRLPGHDTVYAMTIHKSQGSEFDNVVISLPLHWSPLLTKELIYTGITRAKKAVDIFSSPATLAQAVKTKTHRMSGLAGALSSSLHEQQY